MVLVYECYDIRRRGVVRDAAANGRIESVDGAERQAARMVRAREWAKEAQRCGEIEDGAPRPRG